MPSYRATLERLRLAGNLRALPCQGAGDGCIDLSSNDYLGLAARTELQEEFLADAANRRSPLTASASRLLAANQGDFRALEDFLAELYGRPTLLFNSGYHANTGAVSALAAEGTMVLADKLVHASIIDGIVLSRAPFARFAHGDMAQLERLLLRHAPDHERVLVVVESVYSMDGDQCPLDALIDLKGRFPNVVLYVDEAHAFGVLGPKGLGLVAAHPDGSKVDVIVGTLGKAAASAGAFVAVGSTDVRDYLVNRARSFIFSTALPPLQCRWSKFVIERMLDMDEERVRLASLGERMATLLSPYSATPVAASHILPLIVGDAARTVELSRRLADRGVTVLPIRTPTVPPGTERLRFSLSAALTDDDVRRVAAALAATL